nr:NUDIX hydrolase 6-like protein [Tanacetum cinerariifolium]
GEEISEAEVREVKEETGVDTQFVGVLVFKQWHKAFYRKFDLFFVCIMRPLSFDIQIQELEIKAAKELRENTFSGSDHEDANEHIEKVLEIVDLFNIPNITVDQLMLRVLPISLTGATEEINNFQQDPDETLYQAWERFKELLMKCTQHYLTEMQEVILFYDGVEVPTRQILDSRGAILTKTAADAKVDIQKMAEYYQKWHNGTSRGRSTKASDELAAIQDVNNVKDPTTPKIAHSKKKGKPLKKLTTPKRDEENSKLIKEIQTSTDVVFRNQGASIKTLEIQIRKISKLLQERGFGSLPSSTEPNPRDHNRTLMYKTRQTTIPFPSRLNDYYEEKKGTYGPQFSEAYFKDSIFDNYIPQKEKDIWSFTLPCYINNVCFDNALVDLRASVSVFPLSTYLNLGLGELAHTKLTVELADRTVKYPKDIAENILVGIDFAVLEDMDAYRDEGMGDVLVGEPFLREVGIKARRFEVTITL